MGVVIRFPRRKGRGAANERPLFPGWEQRDAKPDANRTSGTDARKHVFRSDALVDDLPRPGVAPDPTIERRRRRIRRSVIMACCAVFVLGLVVSLFAREGVMDVRRQRRAYALLKDEVAADQDRVQALKQRVDDLVHDPTAVEALAREQLDYAAPGEIVLLLPGRDSDTTPGLDDRRGSGIVPGAARKP